MGRCVRCGGLEFMGSVYKPTLVRVKTDVETVMMNTVLNRHFDTFHYQTFFLHIFFYSFSLTIFLSLF